jgi:glycosyltransferase involved in cell wall biosynthesis
VGDGPLRGDMESAARAQSRNGSIRFLGSREDVADLMAASDVMILASAVEGMPGSAIEAGIVGLPVAAYAVAGIPEVVLDGVTGRLVPPNDWRALARCVLEMIRDHEGRRVTREAARERCVSLFGIESVARRYLELYRDLVT